MGLGLKIVLTLIVVPIGAIVASEIRAQYGYGYSLATGIEVLILFYIWTRPSKDIVSTPISSEKILDASRYFMPTVKVAATLVVCWSFIVITASSIFVWSSKYVNGASSSVDLVCYYFNGWGIESRTYIYDVKDIAYKLPPAHRAKSVLKRSCPLVKR